MTEDELDGDDLTGLPERVEPDGTEVVVDPPPKLLRRSESGAIGPLHGIQAAQDLAEAATSGSPAHRRRARYVAWFLFFGLIGLPIVAVLVALFSRLV
ncbi:MAG: hypothetical protein AAGA17_03755 [Actinomycetota bacterium]